MMNALWQRKRQHGGARDDRHVLLAIDSVRHRGRRDARARRIRRTEASGILEELLPGPRVERTEVAHAAGTMEDDVAGGEPRHRLDAGVKKEPIVFEASATRGAPATVAARPDP